MDIENLLKNCEGFDWDKGNELKNWEAHAVKKTETEQVFFNHPLLIFDTYSQSDEQRFLALGTTSSGRFLTIVFTVRKKKLIRVISARDMSKKERKAYEEQN
ncbi:MAG TPA: BrnT family toxin [Bacteriovoracaceae bacterium]|nr:BrnT family toxin [Bacteriovoracaceae bacterium]